MIFSVKLVEKKNGKDWRQIKGRWEVVTLQIAININGHPGYPRKCPDRAKYSRTHLELSELSLRT